MRNNYIDWMQEKLGSMGTFSKGKGFKKGDLAHSGFPIILYGSLYTNYNEFITQVNTFVEDDAKSIKSFGNEVIVPSSGETPKDIARASSVKIADVILGGDLNIIRPEKKINSDFLALSLSNGEVKKELASKAQGASVTHLYNSDIKKVNLVFPSFSEQTSIINIINTVNNIITLEQEKIKKSKQIKKEIIDKLYTTNTNFPNLRFDNFPEPWQNKEIFNVLHIKDIRKPADEEYPLMSFTSTNGVTPKGDRYDRSFLIKNPNKKYKRTDYNNIIYSSNNLDVGAIGLNTFGQASISVVYEVFEVKDGYIPGFVSNLIQRPNELNKILKYRQGALYGQYKIYPEDFLKVKAAFPSKEEQILINRFLKIIDESISSKTNMVNSYTLLKKLFLQNMFV